LSRRGNSRWNRSWEWRGVKCWECGREIGLSLVDRRGDAVRRGGARAAPRASARPRPWRPCPRAGLRRDAPGDVAPDGGAAALSSVSLLFPFLGAAVRTPALGVLIPLARRAGVIVFRDLTRSVAPFLFRSRGIASYFRTAALLLPLLFWQINIIVCQNLGSFIASLRFLFWATAARILILGAVVGLLLAVWNISIVVSWHLGSSTPSLCPSLLVVASLLVFSRLVLLLSLRLLLCPLLLLLLRLLLLLVLRLFLCLLLPLTLLLF